MACKAAAAAAAATAAAAAAATALTVQAVTVQVSHAIVYHGVSFPPVVQHKELGDPKRAWCEAVHDLGLQADELHNKEQTAQGVTKHPRVPAQAAPPPGVQSQT